MFGIHQPEGLIKFLLSGSDAAGVGAAEFVNDQFGFVGCGDIILCIIQQFQDLYSNRRFFSFMRFPPNMYALLFS